jgi:hypothetical protein
MEPRPGEIDGREIRVGRRGQYEEQPLHSHLSVAASHCYGTQISVELGAKPKVFLVRPAVAADAYRREIDLGKRAHSTWGRGAIRHRQRRDQGGWNVGSQVTVAAVQVGEARTSATLLNCLPFYCQSPS